jgi:hypothetical protein
MSNLMEMIAEKAITELARRSQSDRYFSHPELWAREMLGEDDGTLWSKQIEIGNSIVNQKSTAVKAGHGVGKSFLVAVLTCWWIDTRYPDVFVASTAPSQKQIGAIVWREIRKIKSLIDARYKAGEISHTLPGYITADNEWKIDGGTILGFGRKPPDNKTDDSFQGIHAEYVLAIGDEAVGLTEDMIDALGNITSNDNSRRVLIANPTNPGSHFATFFKEDKGWSLHTISVFDSPNFTDEKNSMPAKALAKLTGPSYVEEKKREYGEDSPRYKARVQGEFAWDLGDTLIKPEDIAVAVDTERFVGSSTPTILGVDIARFGADKSVVYKNENGAVRFVTSWEHTPVTESAERVHRAAVDVNATEVRIDGSGIGGGVIDILMQREDVTYTIIDMNPNGQSPERKKWHNARAWWWDKFRLDLRQQNLDLDPDDENYERLTDELQSVEYKFNSQSGGLLVESKDDMKKRGQKSPDFADAAIYASADMEYLLEVTAQPGDRLRTTPEQFLADILDTMPEYLALMRSL